MPGPYAHITLLHELLQPVRMEGIFSKSSGIPATLSRHRPLCALGAVSPDYPNLEPGNGAGTLWADVMHGTHVGKMVTSGIRHLRDTTGTVRDRQLAWFLGYCAHLATDMTIHPVVEEKVGEYSANQRQHRLCEMNQDSYIYRRMDLGEIGAADSFGRLIAQCGETADHAGLDPAIAVFWESLLNDVHPGLSTAHPPKIQSWHGEFLAATAGCRDSANRLFPLAAAIAARIGLSYPAFAAVEMEFIEWQTVPSTRPVRLHYDEIFDHAACNVAMIWRLVEEAVTAGFTDNLFVFGEWNLDTGRDEQGRLVFW